MLVIVLTGLYTMLGGMRAVAYNDAVQVVVLISGSALLTFYGLHPARRLGRAAAHLRLGHVQPVEAADPGGRRGHVGAGDGEEPTAHPAGLVLQRATSPGSAWRSARRSSASGTGARTSTSSSARWARRTRRVARRGSIFAAFLKLFPVVPVHHPGPDLLRAGQERQDTRARADARSGRHADRRTRRRAPSR